MARSQPSVPRDLLLIGCGAGILLAVGMLIVHLLAGEWVRAVLWAAIGTNYGLCGHVRAALLKRRREVTRIVRLIEQEDARKRRLRREWERATRAAWN